MKKYFIFLIAILIFVFFSSSAFASCNLNPERWEWINSTDKMGVFIDKYTIKQKSYNIYEFWMANYCPNGCEIYNGENYHFTKCYIDFNKNAIANSLGIVRDSQGNVIKEWSNNHLKYLKLEPIYPGSIAEDIAMSLRRMIKN